MAMATHFVIASLSYGIVAIALVATAIWTIAVYVIWFLHRRTITQIEAEAAQRMPIQTVKPSTAAPSTSQHEPIPVSPMTTGEEDKSKESVDMQAAGKAGAFTADEGTREESLPPCIAYQVEEESRANAPFSTGAADEHYQRGKVEAEARRVSEEMTREAQMLQPALTCAPNRYAADVRQSLRREGSSTCAKAGLVFSEERLIGI
jgi:hypothetical protein